MPIRVTAGFPPSFSYPKKEDILQLKKGNESIKPEEDPHARAIGISARKARP